MTRRQVETCVCFQGKGSQLKLPPQIRGWHRGGTAGVFEVFAGCLECGDFLSGVCANSH